MPCGLARLVTEHHDADEPGEAIHDRSLGVGEWPRLGAPETHDTHADASIREGETGRQRHQPSDADMRPEDLGSGTLVGCVRGLDGEAIQHRASVKHPVMEWPLLADEAFCPWAGSGDDLKDVRSPGRHHRDDALGVRHDAGALDRHGPEQIPQRHGLARIRGDVIQESRDKTTEGLVDAAAVLNLAELRFDRRRPVWRSDGAGRRILLHPFAHSYANERLAILMIATISLKIRLAAGRLALTSAVDDNNLH